MWTFTKYLSDQVCKSATQCNTQSNLHCTVLLQHCADRDVTCSQVTKMLENLDAFLKRIEPEIESITGEERDTASFMKMMRLFNEVTAIPAHLVYTYIRSPVKKSALSWVQVSAEQQEMDGRFSAMQKTVLLVKRYGHQLPDTTQRLFDTAGGRWNNLRTKVSLAKQRLGPRIQEESENITRVHVSCYPPSTLFLFTI